MKTVLGLFLIIAGIVFGLYVGIWVMFIGGIVQFIDAVTAENIVAMDIAISIARVVFAGIVGWVCFLFGWVFGVACLK